MLFSSFPIDTLEQNAQIVCDKIHLQFFFLRSNGCPRYFLSTRPVFFSPKCGIACLILLVRLFNAAYGPFISPNDSSFPYGTAEKDLHGRKLMLI
uniref:Uncharacterized protein n=1 Tax=Arundo donax TaxID=35708 RepID=A0A0A9HFQ8_ARUDO